MSDKLVDRLRGIYEVGKNGEFGTRCFNDFIPPISFEAADRIEQLESELRDIKMDCNIAGDEFAEKYKHLKT